MVSFLKVDCISFQAMLFVKKNKTVAGQYYLNGNVEQADKRTTIRKFEMTQKQRKPLSTVYPTWEMEIGNYTHNPLL